MNELTEQEESRLHGLEMIITKGEQTFLMIANAFKEICERKLYRKHHGTFQEYMESKWHKSARWAQLMIKSSVVVEELPTEMRTMVRNERTARALSNVPQKERVEVVIAAAKNGPVTAKAIQEAEEVVRKKEKPVVECDALGYPIPPGQALETWHRKQEAQDILTQLERLKSAIKKAQKDGDMFYLSEMEYQYTIARLEQLHYEFTKSKPYAVCLFCQGKLEKCSECNGRGMVSSIYWGREQHPDLPKYRDMRLKEIEHLTQKEKHGHTEGLPTARL